MLYQLFLSPIYMYRYLLFAYLSFSNTSFPLNATKLRDYVIWWPKCNVLAIKDLITCVQVDRKDRERMGRYGELFRRCARVYSMPWRMYANVPRVWCGCRLEYYCVPSSGCRTRNKSTSVSEGGRRPTRQVSEAVAYSSAYMRVA